MTIKLISGESVTIRRFDNGENITFDIGVPVDVDEQTGAYLLSLNCFGFNIEQATSFEEVV